MSTHVDKYDHLYKDYLEVREDDIFGRGVYSKTVIATGVEVIKSDPIVHVISKKERRRICDWCATRRQEELKKCSRCKFVYYCSSVCQKTDWPYHKVECVGISRISPNVPTDTVRLLVRLISWKPTQGDDSGHLSDNQLSIMTSYAPRYSEELKEFLSCQVIGTKLLLAEEDFNAEEIYKMACKLACNSFNIVDSEMMSIGTAVYVAPTLINHSCDPNCIAVFNGRTISIRTIRNVKQNEQLFVSYCELFDIGEKRRKYLQKYHLFRCICDRCHDDKAEGTLNKLMTSTTGLSVVEERALLNKGFDALDNCDKIKNNCDWEELKKTTMTFLDDNINHLGAMNIITIKLREHLMDAYIETCQWSQALQIATLLKTPYEKYYPKINPFLGIHYFKMAKLINQTKEDTPSLKESISLLDKSVGILTVTHGSGHSLVSESKELMRDLYCEISTRTTE